MSKPKRIIMIDDNVDVLDLVREVFESMNFMSPDPIVDTINDSGKALDLLKQYEYDLVLTDLMMPKVSGLQLIEALRTGGSCNRTTPIICISGFLAKIDTSTPADVLENVHFLDKPLDLQKFERLVRLLLPAEKPNSEE